MDRADQGERSWGQRLVVWAIRRYQAVSRFTPPMCRFTPTCSEYTRVAVERHGVPRGLLLGARRLCRCHPFHPGGYDPVPDATRPADPPDDFLLKTDD